MELGEAIRSVLAEDAGPLHLVDAQGAIDRLQASRCARPAVGAQAQRLMRRGSRSASASREAPGRRPPASPRAALQRRRPHGWRWQPCARCTGGQSAALLMERCSGLQIYLTTHNLH